MEKEAEGEEQEEIEEFSNCNEEEEIIAVNAEKSIQNRKKLYSSISWIEKWAEYWFIKQK